MVNSWRYLLGWRWTAEGGLPARNSRFKLSDDRFASGSGHAKAQISVIENGDPTAAGSRGDSGIC